MKIIITSNVKTLKEVILDIPTTIFPHLLWINYNINTRRISQYSQFAIGGNRFQFIHVRTHHLFFEFKIKFCCRPQTGNKAKHHNSKKDSAFLFASVVSASIVSHMAEVSFKYFFAIFIILCLLSSPWFCCAHHFVRSGTTCVTH